MVPRLTNAERRERAAEWLEFLFERLPGFQPIRMGQDLPKKAGSCGTCSVVDTEGFRGYEIRLRSGLTENELQDALLHEYAHYLQECAPAPELGDHTALWGHYYAAAYRVLLSVH